MNSFKKNTLLAIDINAKHIFTFDLFVYMVLFFNSSIPKTTKKNLFT